MVFKRMAENGASCPFPWVLANVPSPNPQQPFAAGNGTGAPRPALLTYSLASRLRASWTEARATKAPRALEVFGETPVSSEPGEDHPAARQDDKALHVVTPLEPSIVRSSFCRPGVRMPSHGAREAAQRALAEANQPPLPGGLVTGLTRGTRRDYRRTADFGHIGHLPQLGNKNSSEFDKSLILLRAFVGSQHQKSQ
jgi:hypothetical protein